MNRGQNVGSPVDPDETADEVARREIPFATALRQRIPPQVALLRQHGQPGELLARVYGGRIDAMRGEEVAVGGHARCDIASEGQDGRKRVGACVLVQDPRERCLDEVAERRERARGPVRKHSSDVT